MDVIGRAVERIDDPRELIALRISDFRYLFADKAMFRIPLGNNALNCRLRCQISIGDEVRNSLFAGRESTPPIVQLSAAGASGRLTGC